MALTALSNGVILPERLARAGVSGKVACAVVGIPSSRLSLCVNVIQTLGGL